MFLDKNGDPWITIGPNYVFTIILYAFVTLLACVLLNMISHASKKIWYIEAGIYFIIFLAYLSLSLTVLLNPGHPVTKKYRGIPNSQWCRK